MADDKNIESPSFDALKCLYAAGGSHEASDVRVRKSVEEFEQHLLKHETKIVELLKEEEKTVGAEKSSTQLATERTERSKKVDAAEEARKISARIAARPELIPTKHKPVKNVLSKMENAEYPGPLSLLCRVINENRKIIVWIRSRSRIRSVLTCYLVAFDKHWNLALTDVNELYFKPKRVKVARGKPSNEANADCIPAALRYSSVDKRANNHETVERHVSQLFVKGDNVVMIAIAK